MRVILCCVRVHADEAISDLPDSIGLLYSRRVLLVLEIDEVDIAQMVQDRGFRLREAVRE